MSRISVPVVVARTEFRRTLRVVVGDRMKLLATGALVLFMLGPIALAGAVLLPAVGDAAAAGGVGEVAGVPVVDALAGGFAVVWLFLVLMATMRSVTTAADVDRPATLLLSTSLRNAVVGTIGAELLLLAVWVVPPAVLLAVAFASGAGTPLPVAFALLVTGLAMVTAVPVGFLLGVCVRHLLTVYEPIARFRTPLFVVLGVAYFGSIALGWFDAVTAALFGLFRGSPLGWPGHLLAVGIPNVAPSPLAVAGALVGAAILVPAALAGGVAAARVHWYADPVPTDADDEDGRDDSTPTVEPTIGRRLTSLFGVVLDRPARTVAVTTIRRSMRAPVRLLYVAYPLFGAFYFAQTVVQTGRLPAYLAVLCCLYVVWGAGALFTLNPLGDLGRVLPAAVTSPLSGREATIGLVAAGALVAVPVAVVVSLAAGFASPLSPARTAALVVATAVGAVATPALAVGVGALFPRFGSVRITGNREAVMPSKTAFLVYTLAIALPVAAAVVLAVDGAPDLAAGLASGLLSLVPGLGPDAVAVPAVATTAVAWATLAAGLAAPLASVRYAVRRFDRFTIE